MRKIIIVLCVLSLFMSAFAADLGYVKVDLTENPISYISNAFSGGDLVGLFKQTKAVSGTSRTFVSTGSVQIAAGYGIVWYTEKPYASMLVVRKNVLIQKIRNGEPTHLDIAQNPIYTQIATALECVFEADFSRMDSLFETKHKGDASSWSLLLSPKDKSVASFISNILMEGGSSFERIVLSETSGDTITYEFSELEKRELTAEEKSVYEI